MSWISESLVFWGRALVWVVIVAVWLVLAAGVVMAAAWAILQVGSGIWRGKTSRKRLLADRGHGFVFCGKCGFVFKDAGFSWPSACVFCGWRKPPPKVLPERDEAGRFVKSKEGAASE